MNRARPWTASMQQILTPHRLNPLASAADTLRGHPPRQPTTPRSPNQMNLMPAPKDDAVPACHHHGHHIDRRDAIEGHHTSESQEMLR
jgi:hypothetical protein